MAHGFLAAVLVSGILAVSGCAGLVPGLEALGAGGGGYPAYGDAQAYPYDTGQGGVYAQPAQLYYQPQPYAYYDNPEVYVYQQGQPVPQATQGYSAPPQGRWLHRGQERRQDRIYPGRAAGHVTPGEARRLHHGPAHIWGGERRMRADANLRHQDRPRLNAIQNRRGQDMNRLRHNGAQPGPRVQLRPGQPGRPAAQLRTAAQPRAHSGRPVRHNGTAP